MSLCTAELKTVFSRFADCSLVPNAKYHTVQDHFTEVSVSSIRGMNERNSGKLTYSRSRALQWSRSLGSLSVRAILQNVATCYV